MKYILMNEHVTGTVTTESREQAIELIKSIKGTKIDHIEPSKWSVKWGIVFMEQNGDWDMRENINREQLNALAAKRSEHRKVHIYPSEIGGHITAKSHKWTNIIWDVLLAGLL